MKNQTAIITKVSPRLWRATSLGAALLDQLAGEHAPAQLKLGLEGGAQW